MLFPASSKCFQLFISPTYACMFLFIIYMILQNMSMSSNVPDHWNFHSAIFCLWLWFSAECLFLFRYVLCKISFLNFNDWISWYRHMCQNKFWFRFNTFNKFPTFWWINMKHIVCVLQFRTLEKSKMCTHST